MVGGLGVCRGGLHCEATDDWGIGEAGPCAGLLTERPFQPRRVTGITFTADTTVSF